MPSVTTLMTSINASLAGLLATVAGLGTVRYVGNSAAAAGADNTSRGGSPTTPYATWSYAHSKCSPGDTIIVLPGHAETLSAAASASSFTSSTAHVTTIGVGNGRKRPTFTWNTATTAQWIITGAGTKFENCIFDFTGFDAIVAAFLVNAADVQFSKCEFVTNSATAGVVSGITVGSTTTSPRFTIVDCVFLGPATNSGTTTTAQVTITDAPDFVFERNKCTGKMTQSITNGAANLRGWIHNNVFVVATGTKAINMHASSTPMISSNRINVPSGTAPIVAAAGFVAGNIYSAAAGVTAGTASTI